MVSLVVEFLFVSEFVVEFVEFVEFEAEFTGKEGEITEEFMEAFSTLVLTSKSVTLSIKGV